MLRSLFLLLSLILPYEKEIVKPQSGEIYIVYSFLKSGKNFYVCSAINCYDEYGVYGLGQLNGSVEIETYSKYNLNKSLYKNNAFSSTFFIPILDTTAIDGIEKYWNYSKEIFKNRDAKEHIFKLYEPNEDVLYLAFKVKCDYLKFSLDDASKDFSTIPLSSYWFTTDSNSYVVVVEVSEYERLNESDMSKFGFVRLNNDLGFRFYLKDH